VKLTINLYSTNMPLWLGAQLKHRDKFTFTFICIPDQEESRPPLKQFPSHLQTSHCNYIIV